MSILPYAPLPALPAPKIAGLLPAHTGPPPKPSPEFTYRNAALTKLSADRRAQFIDAVTTLLDVAVACVHGDMNDNALRAAQVLFHRQLTGHSPDRPITPTAYRAEHDAELLDWLVGARKRLAARGGNAMTDNELAQMLLGGMDDVLHLQRYLNRALDLLNENHDNAEGVRTNLEKAHDTVDDVRDRMLEWMDLIRRMVEQRKSTADAYKAGYEARVVDIIARMSSTEYGALRQALIDLDKDEEIPF